jgi:hypothetical protein
LVAPADTDAARLQAAQKAVGDLAAGSQLLFQTVTDLQPGSIGPDVKVVVYLAVPANLSAVLSSAPQTQFAVMGSGLPQAANLTVITEKPEDLAFMDGYASVIAAPDWRVGALLPSDGANAVQEQEAYKNGVWYFCGLCRVTLQPYFDVPMLLTQPAASDATTWQSSADQFGPKYVSLVYVDPVAASADLLNKVAGNNMLLLGGATPPDAVRSKWAGTIQFDDLSPLKDLWPDLVVGKGGKTVAARVTMTDRNSDLMSDAHMRLFDETAQKLSDGVLSPLSVAPGQ